MYRYWFYGLLASVLVLAGCASSQAAQDTGSTPPPSDASNGDMKPYSEVIPDDATSDEGLFTTHRVDDKLYYEIPDSLFGNELLMVSRIARTATNIGYGGEKANTQVLRWQRMDDKVMLRVVSYENVADEEDPVYRAVQNSNLEPIIKSFDVEAIGPDSTTTVVEVTSLFTTDVPAFGLQQSRREAYRVRRLDSDRTYIEEVQSFPENVDVSNVLTYQAQQPPSNGSTNSITLEMNHSMVLLPEEPMQPRLCDERVGYFSVERTNYSADEQKAAEECFITRWRLEPSDPEAFARGELVEPVEPIVYYIDPATPEKWRPYLKQGVEDWQEAFEQAGFKNAIIAKDPPTEEEDPEFDPDDVRYSTIRYFASDVQNAYGPHVHDPRTGEILESDIGWYHNIMNLLRNWYFVQTAAANPEARAPKFEDEVMGELMRFVSAHEVGHTIGLPHNWGSSHAVPVDSLRSPTYTDNRGTAPSIMDYARFNYVAQPGDGVTNFMPRIGTYDRWSVQWGYQPIPEASTPEEEARILDEMILERAGDPYYFYGASSSYQVDPRSQREDLTGDAMEASRLGIANLQRIIDNLVDWTYQEGENYNTLEEIYGRAVGQWRLYIGHVAREIGGVYETHKTYEQDGPVYEAVPRDRQQAAMQFLVDEVFETPYWLIDTDVLRRFENDGAMERVRQAQASALDLVMDPQRMARLLEFEAIDGEENTYLVTEMMSDVRAGVWSELQQGEAIGPYRRVLQRAYIGQLEELMTEDVDLPPRRFWDYIDVTPVNVAQSDIRAYVRGELETLLGEIETGLIRTDDPATQLHLEDARARIEDVLEPSAD